MALKKLMMFQLLLLLTKYSASITDGTRIREFVDKAYRIATNGYPGAVHLSLPVDIMFSSFEENAGLEERPFSHKAKPVAKAWPDPNAIYQKYLKLACPMQKNQCHNWRTWCLVVKLRKKFRDCW